ncbi:MAG: Na+/H+ antiporter NhaC family protein [Clostridia bacterium]|nr:Na+/H+ antiporter NhaC family protein [Clostridia bacterium]
MLISLIALLFTTSVFATGEEAADVQTAGFKDFVTEYIGADGLESDADFAQAYIDNYDVALQHDTNRAENYEAAVVFVREASTPFFATIWSLLPPIIAIVLALITKEVYSSLFVGIVAGALLNANFNLEGAYNTIIADGFISVLADSWNVGILIFLVVLGMFTALMNKAGGSAAYGAWAKKNIKSKTGALLSTFALGVLIFIDDYFNCLTVGSVMKPVTDTHKISRSKLAYVIDATAAPICMIAPISSWAAAVSGFAPEGVNGIALFCSAIPFNFYSLLTIVFVISISVMSVDFGLMKKHEANAMNGDLFSSNEVVAETKTESNSRGKVIDLIIPVAILIVCCVIGMVYTGGFFDGTPFIEAFSNCDAALGLSLGSVIALLIVFVYFLCRRLFSLKSFMETLPEGFKAMVPAILILTFAWTLCTMTNGLGAKYFVSSIVAGTATGLQNLLPAIIFLIACGLSFATGTSWGTFGILIPIVLSAGFDPALQTIAMSACLAGAVCGDHCSPISDTTIMASAGAQCNHINHVSTQLPYAILVAVISFVMFVISGFVQSAWITLPVGIVLTVATVFVIKKLAK